jgi:hypothetical protein
MGGVILTQNKTKPMLNYTLDELSDFTRKEEKEAEREEEARRSLF